MVVQLQKIDFHCFVELYFIGYFTVFFDHAFLKISSIYDTS